MKEDQDHEAKSAISNRQTFRTVYDAEERDATRVKLG